MEMTTLTDGETRLYQCAVRDYQRHEKRVTALAWSPSGNVLASASADATVRTWTFENTGVMRDMQTHRAHTATVDAIAWSPADPHLLASAASDKNLILWDTRTGKQASAVQSKGLALNLAWDAAGTTVAVGTRDDILHFFDARKASLIGSYQNQQELNEFAFAPSGLLLAGTGLRGGVLDEGNITVLSVQRQQAAQQASAGAGASAQPADAQANAPKAAAAAGLVVSEVTRVRGHAAPVTSLKPAPGWNKIATGAGDGLVCIWDSAELSCTGCIDRADGQIRAIAWSGNGGHMAISSGDTNDTSKFLDVVRADGTLVRRIAGPVSYNHVAWSPSAPIIAFALDDPTGPSAVAAAARAGLPPPRGDFGIKVITAA